MAHFAQLGPLASLVVMASLILPVACSESGNGTGGSSGGTGDTGGPSNAHDTGGTDNAHDTAGSGDTGGSGGTGGMDGTGDAGDTTAGGVGASPLDEGGTAGAGGATNDGATPQVGSGGTGMAPIVIPWGGTTGHDCPDTLLNRGSGPGILCEVGEGVTCADADHRCECGALTFEGAPWRCVPSRPDCPETIPEDGTSCSRTEPCDFVRDGARWRCECTDDGWWCGDLSAVCWPTGPRTGRDCAGSEGMSCDYLRPAYSGIDEPPANVPCVCGADGIWDCADG